MWEMLRGQRRGWLGTGGPGRDPYRPGHSCHTLSFIKVWGSGQVGFLRLLSPTGKLSHRISVTRPKSATKHVVEPSSTYDCLIPEAPLPTPLSCGSGEGWLSCRLQGSEQNMGVAGRQDLLANTCDSLLCAKPGAGCPASEETYMVCPRLMGRMNDAQTGV